MLPALWFRILNDYKKLFFFIHRAPFIRQPNAILILFIHFLTFKCFSSVLSSSHLFTYIIAMSLLTRNRANLLLRALILLHSLVDIVNAYIFFEIFVESTQRNNKVSLPLLPWLWKKIRNKKEPSVPIVSSRPILYFNFTQLYQLPKTNMASLNRVIFSLE